MLYDGLPQAIKNIRTRKGLSQAEAAKHGGTTADSWSQWETRTKRLLRDHLPMVTQGIKVTEFELYREADRLEQQHYIRQAAEIGEPRPIYDTFVTTDVIGGLPQSRGALPAEVEDWQNKLTNLTSGVVATAMSLADCVKDGPPVLHRALNREPAQDREHDIDREDPEEEPADS